MKRLAVVPALWIVAFMGLFAVPPAAAQQAEAEWSRFRGPNGSGVGKADLPVQWTSKDYRWRTKLPDVGHSSPVVWGGRVFVTAGSEADGTLYVCALDVADGHLQWTKRLPGTKHPKNKLNSFASSTPAVDAERVYVAQACPEKYLMIALAAANGQEVWRRDLGPFEAEHGFGSSPMVFEDLVVVPNEQNGPSSIVALDRKTGAIRWQTTRRTARAAYSTPCIYQPEAGPPQLIATSTAHGISSVDPRSGKALWELPLFKQRVVGSPIVAAGLIVASAGSGGQGQQMFAVQPGDPAKNLPPKVAYELKLKGAMPYVPISVTDGQRLFLFNDQGVISCLDARSGEVRWREKIKETTFFGSPVLVGDRLYCMSREGQMIVVGAGDQYKLLARFDLDEPSQSTPAIANGTMYLRTLSHVMALGGKK